MLTTHCCAQAVDVEEAAVWDELVAKHLAPIPLGGLHLLDLLQRAQPLPTSSAW